MKKNRASSRKSFHDVATTVLSYLRRGCSLTVILPLLSWAPESSSLALSFLSLDSTTQQQDCARGDLETTTGQSATCQASMVTTTTSVSSSSSTDESGHSLPLEQQCGLWLAPSSLPDTGLGMYAGRNYSQNEHLQDSGDMAIPIVDLRLHWDDPDASFLWDEYTWSGSDWDPHFQLDREGYDGCDFASPGFGSAANSFLPLQNVEEEYPVWDNAGLHRSRDPGAGAVSQYRNRVSYATRDIEAGEELFVSYGETWFTGREFLGPIPLFDDLDRATALARAFSELYRSSSSNHRQQHNNKNYRAVLKELWSQFVQKDTVYKGSRVLGAFNHSDPSELEQLESGMAMTEIRMHQSKRDLDWLREHGVCVDHIGARSSTLPQAGEGAFARRNLPRGTVVTSLPMIHIPDRTIFDMYPVEIRGAQAVVRRTPGRSGRQLLINYCYGHEDSSLLLCPYGPHGSYINHNQTLANVKLLWSDPNRSNHQPKYLDQPIEALLLGSKSAKLSMDVVATRDIADGEEIFLDYGDKWEAAWNLHVEQWKPPEISETYRYAVELNRDDPPSVLPTVEELAGGSSMPRHPNVEIACSALFVDSEAWKVHYPNNLDDYLANETVFGEDNTYRCDVTGRRVDDSSGNRYLYNATVWTWDEEVDPYAQILEEHASLVDIPRQAFAYFQKPYTSDTFLPGAFRHHIGIPDELMPDKWRNLRTTTIPHGS